MKNPMIIFKNREILDKFFSINNNYSQEYKINNINIENKNNYLVYMFDKNVSDSDKNLLLKCFKDNFDSYLINYNKSEREVFIRSNEGNCIIAEDMVEITGIYKDLISDEDFNFLYDVKNSFFEKFFVFNRNKHKIYSASNDSIYDIVYANNSSE